MKYIKTYERLGFLNKKTVDYNKIYALTRGDDVYAIGKIIPNPGNGFRDTGCILISYNEKTGEEQANIIRYGTWQFVREAKPEEIEKYNILHNLHKYNI